MFATTTIATASLIASAAAAAASAYGAYQQGQSAKAQGAYQAGVMRNNQILAERAAMDAEQRGKLAEEKRAIQGRQLIGRQRAALAGNGVEVDTGSALDITADTAAENQHDALVIRHNAELEAGNYRAQGMNFSAGADLASLKGDQAATAGEFGAGTSLLSGAGSVAGKWYDLTNSGAFTTPKTNLGVYSDYQG